MTSVDRIQGLSGSLAIKAPVRVATTANITLSGEQTIDGVAVVEDDRVLVKDQTDTTENGIYNASTGPWARALDFDGANDVKNGTQVLVTAGAVGANLVYRTSGTDPISFGTSALTFPVSLAATAVSAFMATVLDDADAAAVLTTLGVSAFAKTILDAADEATFKATVNLEIGTDVQAYAASASQVEMEAGTEAALRSMSPLRVAQAIAALGGGSTQIQPISASVGSNALTISASALSLDFRSATLGSGTVTTVSGTPANLVISSGSTLGTVSAKQSRIAVLALNNAGTIELAAVNVSGGNDLSETGVISTTAEGGAGAADTANVIYSTTARSNLAYRVIGYIESTQATAGTWATAPSTIQGAGGNAVTAMSSLGYGQTWQDVTGSRAAATTYYNTTGRPILVSVTNTSAAGNSTSLTVNGIVVANAYISAAASSQISAVSIVPPGGSYSVAITGTIGVWAELR